MKEEDLSNKSKELLAVSPYGKVPAVVMEDGRVLYESAVINEYLDDIYPDPPLMPPDPYERAQVRLWTDFGASRVVPPLYRILKSSHPEKVERSWPELHAELASLERHLKSTGGPWFLGRTFTLADINFLPFGHRIATMEGDIPSQYPAFSTWHQAYQERPAYSATLQEE